MATYQNTNYAQQQQDLEKRYNELFGQQEQPRAQKVTTQSASPFKLTSSQKLTLKIAWNVVVVLAIFLVIMLIVRAFWLWYWKVNKIVSLLESIDESNKGTSRKLDEVNAKLISR